MKIEENVQLSTLTTFRTGGPARFLLTLENAAELSEAILFSKNKNLQLIPLGSGSNMLAPDRGVDAVFVKLTCSGLSFIETDGHVVVRAEAGCLWDTLVAYTVTNGWWGLENLSAIPGTVGAAVVQNIGAYGAALSDTVQSVEVFDTVTGEEKTFETKECEFGYRISCFKKEVDRYVVTKVSFVLSKESSPNISYRDLKQRFENITPSLQNIRDAVIEIRQGKFPPLDSFGTAGSFFLNPIVSNNAVEELSKRFPGMPFFQLPEGGVKVPIAWILDRVLALKGERFGKAFLWEQQVLVIAGEFGVTSAEVISLATEVAHLVFEKTGIHIQPEVRLFGAEKNIA